MTHTSPSPKRIKLDPSPSASSNDQNPKPEETEPNDDPDNNLEQPEEAEHCTICLQSFLDKTIISVCAHEFCFECILLWSEQSRKCPLCSRSFDNSYLIHRIRSQYDYQKHYLLPLRTSPPPLTGESRANALRNTRRERQWGRRQRQQREEADQLERAIARRRWIYQHHLYAKHIASNAYTRYRPFPTPAQFAASPDLISRMTIFLRRELRVWPNLDVEFLTTYTISLMKAIDIRSESAVKLLSEFLDLDSPYTPGARHVHAEHFAHEIYSYLRSPYRDLNTYDQTAQYDTPPEVSPPQEIERGSRWSAEPSPSRRSRSRSNSRHPSPVPHRRNNERHGRDRSAEARNENRPSRRHGRRRSPRSILPDQEDHDLRNHPSGRRHSPPDGVQDILRNGRSQSRRMSVPEASSSAVVVETQSTGSSIQHHPRGNQKGKGQVTANMAEFVPRTDTPKMNVPQGDDVAAVLAVGEASVTRLIDGPLQGAGDEVVNYVDKVLGGSSANLLLSRKRSAGLDVHPRNRTLSESVQAYLSRPRYATKKRRDVQPVRASDTGTSSISTTDRRPALLLRLTDGPTDPDVGKIPRSRTTIVEVTAKSVPLMPSDDTTFKQQHHGCRSQSCDLLSDHTAARHANANIRRGDQDDGGGTRSRRFLSDVNDEVPVASSSDDRSPGWLGFPPVTTPWTRNANVALTSGCCLVGRLHPGTRHGDAHRIHMEMGGTCDGERVIDDDGLDTLGRCATWMPGVDVDVDVSGDVDVVAATSELEPPRVRLAAIEAPRVMVGALQLGSGSGSGYGFGMDVGSGSGRRGDGDGDDSVVGAAISGDRDGITIRDEGREREVVLKGILWERAAR